MVKSEVKALRTEKEGRTISAREMEEKVRKQDEELLQATEVEIPLLRSKLEDITSRHDKVKDEAEKMSGCLTSMTHVVSGMEDDLKELANDLDGSDMCRESDSDVRATMLRELLNCEEENYAAVREEKDAGIVSTLDAQKEKMKEALDILNAVKVY